MKTEFTTVKRDSLRCGIVFAFISAGSCCYAVKGQDNDNTTGFSPLFMFPETAFPYPLHSQRWERVNQSLHSWGKSVSCRKQGILHGDRMLFWGLNAWGETCTPGVSGWVEKWQLQLYWVPSACHSEKTDVRIMTAAALESKEILQSGRQIDLLSFAEKKVSS